MSKDTGMKRLIGHAAKLVEELRAHAHRADCREQHEYRNQLLHVAQALLSELTEKHDESRERDRLLLALTRFVLIKETIPMSELDDLNAAADAVNAAADAAVIRDNNTVNLSQLVPATNILKTVVQKINGLAPAPAAPPADTVSASTGTDTVSAA